MTHYKYTQNEFFLRAPSYAVVTFFVLLGIMIAKAFYRCSFSGCSIQMQGWMNYFT